MTSVVFRQTYIGRNPSIFKIFSSYGMTVICINDFMFSGGDNYKFDGATDIKVYNNLFVRDILIDRIKKEKKLTLPEPDCLTDLAEKQSIKESA